MSPAKRPKSRSAVHSSRTPCRRHSAATRIVDRQGDPRVPSAPASGSGVDCNHRHVLRRPFPDVVPSSLPEMSDRSPVPLNVALRSRNTEARRRSATLRRRPSTIRTRDVVPRRAASLRASSAGSLESLRLSYVYPIRSVVDLSAGLRTAGVIEPSPRRRTSGSRSTFARADRHRPSPSRLKNRRS